ncbi:MAG TPA: hypothetical protein PLU72_17265 [Candidatus Ozemobacteraceae bacterium]|nr:hypothetical protein [Candidatus Ozemobacteraceae bacterium]HQG28239.1 hypothetical protein [Candidatus Ozemobacteraceae bacterium]
MATSAIMRSQAFFEAKLTQRTVTILGSEDGKTSSRASQPPSSDRLELSSFSSLRGTIETFKSGSTEGARLDITFSIPQDRVSSGVGDGKASRDFDLMLRMFARDEEDYARLKSRFEELLGLASGRFESDGSVGSSSSGEFVAQASQPTGSDETLSREELLKRNLEVAEAFVARVERRQVEVRVQVARAGGQLDVQQIDLKQADPLVLDLAGDGLDLGEAGEAATFDVNADGTLDKTGWVRGDDALLVYDRNGNGLLDDGSELFGDQNGSPNGFAELSKYDGNRDGRIDSKDSIFKALKLYRDLNGNGRVDAGELQSLAQSEIVSLNLRFLRETAKLNGNSLLLRGSFERADGTIGRMDDVLFGFRDAK